MLWKVRGKFKQISLISLKLEEHQRFAGGVERFHFWPTFRRKKVNDQNWGKKFLPVLEKFLENNSYSFTFKPFSRRTFALFTSNCHVASNFFISSDTESSDCISCWKKGEKTIEILSTQEQHLSTQQWKASKQFIKRKPPVVKVIFGDCWC